MEVYHMKNFKLFLQVSLILITSTVIFACSSLPEKTAQQDEFFVPVNQVVRQKAGTGTVVYTRGGYAARVDDWLKDSLMEMLRQQNHRLDNVVQHLNSLTNRENADNSMNTDNHDDALATHSRISNEMLLEMLRDQNQRLNDVVDQLKLLSQNQSMHHSNLTARVDVSPIQEVPVRRGSTSHHLNASLNYGKAIQLYQNRQYEKAIDAFKKLLDRRIEPKLADRYHFWMGVCYFNLKRGNQAINEFEDALEYANSEKAESAYFMIGQCYERMGSRKNAKLAFEKMLQVFPRGSLTQITETKLALLK
jgi:TolA-binding protein